MRPATPVANGKAVCALFITHMRLVEVRLLVADHAITRVAIRSQERVIVAYAVQRLPHRLLRESGFPAVLGRERLDRPFFCSNVALDLPPAPFLRNDLLRRSG